MIKYKTASLEVIYFETEDVLTSSQTDPDPDHGSGDVEI